MQGIILAGGMSSRMKHNKMLLFYMGKPLIEYAIQLLTPFVNEIIVVTGHYHDDIAKYLSGRKQITVIKNTNYKNGMFSSVKTGVKAAKESVLIMPGDMPKIQQTTIQAILNGIGSLRVPSVNNQRGHPLYLDQSLFKALLKEPDTSHLKAFRNKHVIHHIKVNDTGILIDIDTPTELIQLRKGELM
ncbi:MAG: nucleotidyltransferase family protein [Bacillota bacterium]